MKKYYRGLFVPIGLIFLFFACGRHHDRAGEPGAAVQSKNSSQNKTISGKRRGAGLNPARNMRSEHRIMGTEGITLTEGEREAIFIQTTAATIRPINSHLSALGKVIAHPSRKAIVSYAFPARISQIHVQIGDWVEKGQLLVTLQSEEVGNAKSEFYMAGTAYELAKVNSERLKRLFDRGVGALKDHQSAEAELKVAQANLNAAEKKLHVLGFSEEQVLELNSTHQINPVISLYAPIAGKIIANNAILGGMVDQSTEILIIMDPTILCIDADIYEKDIAKILIGQKVEVKVPAYPNEVFHGQIRYISDVLKEETRTITVRTQVENRGMKLKAGMFADIKIFLNHEIRALVIPGEAVLEDKGDDVVFTQKGGKYFMHVVQLGPRENGFIQVLDGLDEGAEVVTSGSYQLKSKLYEQVLKQGHVH